MYIRILCYNESTRLATMAFCSGLVSDVSFNTIYATGIILYGTSLVVSLFTLCQLPNKDPAGHMPISCRCIQETPSLQQNL